MRPADEMRRMIVASVTVFLVAACGDSSPEMDLAVSFDAAVPDLVQAADLSISPSPDLTNADGNTDDAASCAESPCKLTAPQCGCGASMQCSIVSMARQCVAEGTLGEAQICDGSSLRCAPALFCGSVSPSVSLCKRFCADDAACTSPGGLCVVPVSDGMGGTVAGVTLCSQNCDPVGSAECPSGTRCQIDREPGGAMRSYTACEQAGVSGQGAACDPASPQCSPGFACVDPGGGSRCLKYCRVGSGVCPATTSCASLSTPAVIGGQEYGVCI